ncbi:hypothetical protein GYMLUDRAFT_118524, partial [Collybiopsis luxurians FD-317 M1]
ALKHLAGHHTSRSEEGGHYNYWAPPARCLLSPDSDDKKARLFKGWLRIRDIVLFLLSDVNCTPFCLSNKEWRTLLQVCSGHELNEGDGSRNASHRRNVREHFKTALEKSQVQLDVNNLFGKTPTWKGSEVIGLLDPDTAREILWELCELNFRSDVLALDRHLDRSNASVLERQDMLDQCWNGSA